MSRYIGKRVSYPCSACGNQFTLTKKCFTRDHIVLCEKCTKNLNSYKQRSEESTK